MTYVLPDNTFNAVEAARNRLIFANQYTEQRIANYKSGYDRVWQTPRSHGDNSLSMAESQATLDVAPIEFVKLLTKSAQEVAAISQIHPGLVGDGEEHLMPTRYLSSPYVYQLDNVTFADAHTEATIASIEEMWTLAATHGEPTALTLTLISLKPEWEVQVEEEAVE